jgi:hypothetical protein
VFYRQNFRFEGGYTVGKKNREISEQNLKKFNTPRWFPSSPFASIARLRPPIPSPGLHGDRGIF